MIKNIKIFLLLLFTCLSCFLIHDNVHALNSNSLDNDLTNINNHFEISPLYQYNDYKVTYCNDYGTTWCHDNYNTDSSAKINVDFVDFLDKHANDNKTKLLYIINKTSIDTDYESTTPYIFLSLNHFVLKKRTYVDSHPTAWYRGNTYQFLYADDADDKNGNYYYFFRKIGDKQFSFNVMTKDTYNIVFNVLYDNRTNKLYNDTYYIYSNIPILFDDGSPFVGSSTITVPPQEMGPLQKFIHDLFVPSNDFFSSWFNEMSDEVSKQMGFLSYPFVWILDFLENFLTLEDTGQYVISWNDIKVPNFESFSIIKGGSFDLASLLKNDTLNAFHQLYFLITDALLVIAFLYLCMNTYNRIFGGDVDKYEYISSDEGYNIDPDTGEVMSQWVRNRRTRKERIKWFLNQF